MAGSNKLYDISKYQGLCRKYFVLIDTTWGSGKAWWTMKCGRHEFESLLDESLLNWTPSTEY